MLVLGVRSGEYITIGQDIVIQVVKAGEVTRLAVQAPRECPVVRGKLVESSGGAPDCIRKLRQKLSLIHICSLRSWMVSLRPGASSAKRSNTSLRARMVP